MSLWKTAGDAEARRGPARRHRAGHERVVLVHCSAGSGGQWKSLTEEFGKDLTPMAIDLYGHGRRQAWRGEGPLTLDAEASAISDTVSGDESPFHLIGHSYGGAVALRFALGNAKRLRSLTLIEPSCFHVLKESRVNASLLDEIRLVARAVNDAVVCGDYHAGMEVFIDYWGGAGTWTAQPEEEKARLAAKAVIVGHHFWNLIEEGTPLPAYAQLLVPTLILCGTRSPAPSRAITRMLAETLPNSKHRTLRGANHLSPITHPEKVNALIRSHLEVGCRLPDPEASAVSDQSLSGIVRPRVGGCSAPAGPGPAAPNRGGGSS